MSIAAAAVALALIHVAPAWAQHDADVWLGQNGASVALSTEGHIPSTEYDALEPANLLFHGWSNNNPGFDHVRAAGGGVLPLPEKADIWLEVVRFDPGFFTIDGGQQVLELPGDDTYLGTGTLHTHITWLVDQDDPSYLPTKCVWQATFRLYDAGDSRLQDSAPFTFLFSTVPVRAPGVSADGDFYEDGSFDAADKKALGVCVGGPGVRPTPHDISVTTCEVDCHNAFDMDDDLDVDLRDIAKLAVSLGS